MIKRGMFGLFVVMIVITGCDSGSGGQAEPEEHFEVAVDNEKVEVCQKVWRRGNDNGSAKKYYDNMKITIEIKCPRCLNPGITRNGKKYSGKQNCRCSRCGHQLNRQQQALATPGAYARI
ncbi:MAG: hypothetical protein LBK61_09345 [Spirochaetaceae bacterium]|jgi:hypothetical protein|nr:hypothetical protein [Spirochaetaceae bacterium]